jgi:hypothetical protein
MLVGCELSRKMDTNSDCLRSFSCLIRDHHPLLHLILPFLFVRDVGDRRPYPAL